MSGAFRPVALEIDSLEIPIFSALDYTEDIQPKGGLVLLRTVRGLGIRQFAWKKHIITVSGSGSIPSALGELDVAAQHTLKLAMHRTVQGAGLSITVPATHRTDLTLTMGGVSAEAFAVMDRDNLLRQTTITSFVGNIVTFAAVTGALSYRVNYWPQFTVYIDPPAESMDVRGAEHGWTLTAEEI